MNQRQLTKREKTESTDMRVLKANSKPKNNIQHSVDLVKRCHKQSEKNMTFCNAIIKIST